MPGAKIVTVHYTPAYLRAYAKLPVRIQALQDTKEQVFRANPFARQLRTHKLRGRLENLWSYAVNLSYRVLFRFLDDRSVIFYDIGTHEIYR